MAASLRSTEIPIVPKASSRKYCARCRLSKPLSDVAKSRRDGWGSYCRACKAVIQKRSRHRETRRKYKSRNRLKNKLLRMAYLWTHPCVDCGESDPRVLEFDHRGEKRGEVSVMVKDAVSWTVVEKEIAACEVRCANCHRRKTVREQTGSGTVWAREFWEEWQRSGPVAGGKEACG